MTVLILIPTKGRTARLVGVAANVLGATHEDHHLAFIVEPDEYEATIAELGGDVNTQQTRWADVLVNTRLGHHGAYNTALEAYAFQHADAWDWWFHGADDLRFHDGWLTECADAMADPAVQVIGTNDLLSRRVQRGDTATHYLVRREYTEGAPAVPGVEPPEAYFAGYHHQFVETEFVDVAKERGVFRSVPSSIVEHRHYLAGKADWDDGYADAESHHDEDRILYDKRKAARVLL